MTLKDYLELNKIGISDFADIAKLKQPYVSLIIHGKRRPSPEIAEKIELATSGAVNRMELLYPEQEAS